MESVRSIAISPNGKRIASCSPLFIRIWDMKTGDLIHTIQDNKDSWKLPSPIGFNDSRKNAIFSNDNKILRVQEKGNYSYWDVQSGSVVQWKKEDFLRSDSLQYDSPNRFQNISINHLGENILLSLVLPSDLSSKEKEIISHHIEFPRWINFEYFFQPSHLLSQAQLSKWQKKMRNLIH
jgi:WD40 repeat protein